MHELGIVFHIIKSVEKVGAEQNLRVVSDVTLELGEVSGVVDAYLQDCWKWAAGRSALLQGAQLKIEKVLAKTLCEDCGKTYGTVEHGKICPYCGGENTHLTCGNEMNIKEISAC
ncbi:MAG: hydrogenase maturation nickel metallochaperone HypA [Oscillospiraceae bacterium]|nr:hydrogenase maturation nickel metallochaperone HypA [Oscillospiraceae bacterium]